MNKIQLPKLSADSAYKPQSGNGYLESDSDQSSSTSTCVPPQYSSRVNKVSYMPEVETRSRVPPEHL